MLGAWPTGTIIFVLLIAFVAGSARGFSGFGGALIFVPLASAAVGPQLAAPVLLIADGVLSLGMLPNGWRLAKRREVFTMAAGALLGVPAGTALLALMPMVAVRWTICVVVLLLLAFLISGWRYRSAPLPGLTVGVGALAGLFGGAAQISGPPVVAYWLGGANPAGQVRANLVLYFAVSTVISAVAYLAAGLLTLDALRLAVIAGPAYGVGILLGSMLFGRASEQTFRTICFVLIACAAVVGLPLFDGWR